MRKTPLFFFFSIFFLGLLFLFHPWPSAAQKKPVYVIEIHDAITPATAGFIQRAIDRASRDGAQCLVIQLDTPGGLDTSMRDIVKEILNADLPVVIYVAPSGARTRLDPEGKVFIHGELWNADSDETIEEGEKVRVLKTDRLKLRVEKLK